MKKIFIIFFAVIFFASASAFAQQKITKAPEKKVEAAQAENKAPDFPIVDVIKGAENYVIIAEIPGVDSKDIALEYIEGEKNYVELNGQKGEIDLKITGEKILKERFAGKFNRRIDIADDIIKDKITAEFKDSVLMITLPIRKFQVKTSIKIK